MLEMDGGVSICDEEGAVSWISPEKPTSVLNAKVASVLELDPLDPVSMEAHAKLLIHLAEKTASIGDKIGLLLSASYHFSFAADLWGFEASIDPNDKASLEKQFISAEASKNTRTLLQLLIEQIHTPRKTSDIQ